MNPTATAAYEQALSHTSRLLRAAEHVAAMHLARHLIQMAPTDCRPFYLLGLAMNGQQKFAAAREPLRHAASLTAAAPEIWLALASSFNGENRLTDAEACYRNGLTHAPTDQALAYSLARNLEAQRETAAALACYRDLCAVHPNDTNIREGLWRCLRNSGQKEELCSPENHPLATTTVLRLIRAKTLIELGKLNQLTEAEQLLEHILADDSQHREALTTLQVLYRLTGEFAKVDQLASQLLKHYPDRTEGYVGKIEALISADRDEEAVAIGWQSLRCGGYGVLMHAATFMAAIPHSSAHILRERNRAHHIIDALLAKGIRISAPLKDMPLTRFYYAYHGLNNKSELTYLTDSLRRLAPSLNYTAPHVKLPRKHGPLRVAFISSYLYDHPAGRCFQPVVEAFHAQPDVAIAAFTLLKQDDPIQNRLRDAGITLHALPKTLEEARAAVEHTQPDVIVYTDIGMDILTYYLAFSRLARLQVQLAGHPESSGIDTIDCFVSQRDSEGPNPQSRYREYPALLKSFAMAYPAAAYREDRRTRAELCLPAARFYLVPAKLQKIHPDFDRLIADILRRDTGAVALFFEDHTCTGWKTALQHRLQQSIPDVCTRIVFRPWAEKLDFQAILAHADAVLDPTHFGLGTTALYAFAQGVPVLTRPYDNLASRPVCAMLKNLQVFELIADNDQEFVERAVRLANDPAWRQQLGDRIIAAFPGLFDAGHAATELLRLFQQQLNRVASQSRRGSHIAQR